MLRVAAFTGGQHLGSARFRVRQYIQPLAALEVKLDEYAARYGSFPPSRLGLRPAWGFATLIARLPAVAMSHRYDMTFLQREMVSTFRTLEPFTRRPRVLDMDDAIWLHRRGRHIEKIVQDCDAVICGNEYLADWASQHNSRVSVLPTGVDTERFRPPLRGIVRHGKTVIGWMGQSSGYRYLEAIREAIRHIAGKHRSVVFRIVSDRPPPDWISRCGVEFVKWSAHNEVSLLQSFDIGIMPMEKSPWCLGKCSYKMLLYMSCGLPVVVSDFGMNAEILKRGCIGCGVSNTDEWIQALECLIDTPALRYSMGSAGRRVIETSYSVNVLAPRLACLLERGLVLSQQEASAHG